MTEEGTPPVEAPLETAVETIPTSLVSADGTLAEGWQQQAPEGYEDLRDDKSLGTIKQFWDLSKSFVHVRKQVPVDKMPRPNDKWTDAEWDDFYTIAGRPDTPEDYGTIDPPSGWDERIMSWDKVQTDWQQTFHKLGLNQKQIDGIKALNDKHNELFQTSVNNMNKEEQDRINDALHDEWGRAYDQKSFRAEKAVERGANGDDALLDHVMGKMKDDVQMMRWMSNMEDQFSEHDAVERANIPTPGDLQEQIDELRADPRFLSDDKRTRQPLINKINRLTEQKLKEKQPV